jgi:hypothetical protein
MAVQNAHRPRAASKPRLADQLFIAGSTVAYGALMGVVCFALQVWGR